MNDFVFSTVKYLIIPSMLTFCLLYATSKQQFLRIIFAISTLFLGLFAFYSTILLDEALKTTGNSGMSTYVRDYFVFVCSIFSGALGINMLTNALDYSEKQRRALEYISDLCEKRIAKQKDKIRTEIQNRLLQSLQTQDSCDSKTTPKNCSCSNEHPSSDSSKTNLEGS